MFRGKLTALSGTVELTDTSRGVKTFLVNADKLLSANHRRDLRATSVSETVWTYDYAASTTIIMSVFVAELQVFEIPAFFWVDPVFRGLSVPHVPLW
jgi:hypothetical protein